MSVVLRCVDVRTGCSTRSKLSLPGVARSHPGVCPPSSLSCCCRFDDGVALCESLLELCPESCTLREALADLHIRNGNGEQAVSMWLHALAECPNNAEVFYHCCTFLMAQVSLASST